MVVFPFFQRDMIVIFNTKKSVVVLQNALQYFQKFICITYRLALIIFAYNLDISIPWSHYWDSFRTAWWLAFHQFWIKNGVVWSWLHVLCVAKIWRLLLTKRRSYDHFNLGPHSPSAQTRATSSNFSAPGTIFASPLVLLLLPLFIDSMAVWFLSSVRSTALGPAFPFLTLVLPENAVSFQLKHIFLLYDSILDPNTHHLSHTPIFASTGLRFMGRTLHCQHRNYWIYVMPVTTYSRHHDNP